MTTPIVYKASDIITDTLQDMGVYAPGENISDADMSRGLTVLNDMLDQWQNEGLFIFSLTPQTLNLANQVPTYSIGPVNSPSTIANGRPSRIQSGPGAASVTFNATTYPVNVVSRMEFDAIQGVDPGGGVPDTLYYDPQSPVGILNTAPTPNANGMVMTFYSLTPFYSFSAYTTSAAFSQGTTDALKSNLSINLKPYFATAQLDPIIGARAVVGKEFLRTSNIITRAKLKSVPSPVGKPAAQSNPA